MDEVKVAKRLDIPIHYIPIERRFKGDGSTRIRDSDTKAVRIGQTYSLRSFV